MSFNFMAAVTICRHKSSAVVNIKGHLFTEQVQKKGHLAKNTLVMKTSLK